MARGRAVNAVVPIKVCVLAFSEPPSAWGFARSRKGTSWWIRIEPARVPRCLSALKERGIQARAIWPDDDSARNPPPSPSMVKGKKGRGRGRGKAARKAYAAEQAVRRERHLVKMISHQARALAAATALNAEREARFKREEPKRKAELKTQRRQQAQRDAVAAAREAARRLLEHPVGSA